ncbi:3738_t:CDS:2, partial [Funneliformis geosporum]
PTNVYVTTYQEVTAECDKPIYNLMPFIEKLPYFNRIEALKKAAKINELYNGIIEEKRKSMETEELDKKINNNTADFLDCMMYTSGDPKNPMSNEEMRNNLAAMFMLVGHDTRCVQRKVRDEMLRVLGDDLTPIIDYHSISGELKYLYMVMDENLRFYPPVHQLPRRENSEIIKFRNHVFWPKTPILINIYGIHHSPKYWKDPEEFIPERFEDGKLNRDICLPFGGNMFSLIEQTTTLCALLRKYEISLPADSIHKDKLHLDHFNALQVERTDKKGSCSSVYLLNEFHVNFVATSCLNIIKE